MTKSPPYGPGKCSRCGADVTLARTAPAGAIARLDPRPSPAGAFLLEHKGGRWQATHYRDLADDYDGPLWPHHNVTCTNRPPPALRKPRPEQLQLGRGIR